MRHLTRALAVTGLFVVAIFGCQQTPSDKIPVTAVSNDSQVVVELLPAEAKAAVGDTILVSLQVTANRGLSGADVELSFNSDYLQAIAFGDGDAFGPSPLRGKDHIDNESGLARIALARVGPSELVGPLEATLATIMFEVVGSPVDTEISLSVVRVELVDSDYNIVSDVLTSEAVLSIGQ